MKWFDSQSKVVRFVLLIIPLVGWVCEVIVRWSEVAKKPGVLNIFLALVYTLVGWAWILAVIDAILVLVTGKMLLR